MIRFINLKDQILNGSFCFAWYDTIRDRFIEIGEEQAWWSWQDFEEDYRDFGHVNSTFTLERFYFLFPKCHIEKLGLEESHVG